MAVRDVVQAAAGIGGDKLYVDDVFSTYIYNGNGSTQTITNGIDLAGEGGMVWIKERADTSTHGIFDTTRGAGKWLTSASTQAESTVDTATLSAFTSTGFSLGSSVGWNQSGVATASWAFRNAPKFFTHTTVSHTNGTATNIDLSSLGTVGMVVVKRTDSTSDWIVAHRSIAAPDNLKLNTTGSIIAAGVTISGNSAVISSAVATGTYVIYAWAHDASTEGMIQCGLLTDQVKVTLGWEPQVVLAKYDSSVSNWFLYDSMRGIVGTNDKELRPNTTDAESNNGGVVLAPDGFTLSRGGSATGIYLAIRMPNKPPTSGTDVYKSGSYTGTNVDNRLVNTGIKTDMAILYDRSTFGTPGMIVGDRLRGQSYLGLGVTSAEVIDADSLDQQQVSAVEYGTAFSSMTGVFVGNDATARVNASTTSNGHWFHAFKRAPGFFDIVCYTGTGVNRTVTHQLGVAPELMIVKSRSNGGTSAYGFATYYGDNTKYLRLETTAAAASSSVTWNNTSPTNSVFSIGTENHVNFSGATYVAYLFASLPGISKVGTYIGNGGSVNTNGTSQTIDCGFTTGARFVLIKSVNRATNWFVLETVQTGGDYYQYPYVNGPQGTVDEIDTSSSGFVINQISGRNNNVTGDTYIYLAIA